MNQIPQPETVAGQMDKNEVDESQRDVPEALSRLDSLATVAEKYLAILAQRLQCTVLDQREERPSVPDAPKKAHCGLAADIHIQADRIGGLATTLQELSEDVQL